MSIQNELNQIKNAVYGREVRQAIHDGIEKAYNDATSGGAGDTNLEVVLARGNYDALNKRLDASDSQLADKVDKVSIDNNSHSIKFYSNGKLVSEIDITEAGNTASVREYIDQLVTDGLIEGATIADESITVDKSNFVEYGENLFNKLTITPFKAISGSNGSVVDSENFSVTDYIKVQPNTQYKTLNANFVTLVFFDKDKNYISGIGSSTNSFTTPSDCKYIRGTVGLTYVDVFFVGRSNIEKYSHFGYDFKSPLSSQQDISASVFKSLYDNYLKDISEWEEYSNRISFTNGNTAGVKNGRVNYEDSSTYSYTSGIDVNPGEVWKLSGYGNPNPAVSGFFLDANGQLVEVLRYDPITEQFLIVPEKSKKMIITVLTSSISSLSVSKAVIEESEKDLSQLTNIHYADLTDNYTYTSGKFVRKLIGRPIEYADSSITSYSEEIPVKEGEVWRTIDYSIPKGSTWNARGVFMDVNGTYIKDIPFDKIDSYTNTFEIPKQAAKMIVNKRATTRLYKLVDWESIFDYKEDHYEEGFFISSNGSKLPSEFYGYLDVNVSEGDIIRITDIAHGDGTHITARGVFAKEDNTVVKAIKVNQTPPYQWNDVVVPSGATKIRVNFLLSVNDTPNNLKRITVSKAVKPNLHFGDNSAFRDKVWVGFGASTTWYEDWPTMVKQSTQLKFVNHGFSGHTIAQTSHGVDLCDDTKLNDIINEKPDLITILGGNNDKGYNTPLGDMSDLYTDMGQEDKSTFIGAFSYIIKKLKSELPNSEIVIAAPVSAKGDYPNNIGLLVTDYAVASKEIAEFFGLRWIDSRGKIGLNKYTLELLTRDDVHLNFRGSPRLANEALSVIREVDIL